MMGWNEIVQKKFQKSTKDLSHKEKAFFKKLGNNMALLLWGIGKFIFLLYVFRRIHARIGFEETIIILAVIIMILLRSNLKKRMIE